METARKIRNHFGKPSIIGMLPSLKMNGIIRCESLLENDCAMLLEASKEVQAYQSQPFTFEYWDGQKYRIYTPDFFVTLPARELIIEVKPSTKLEKYAWLFKCISEECAKNSLPFVILTEKELRVQPRLDNIKLLYRYARTEVTLSDALVCQELFQGTPSMPLGTLLRLLAERGLQQEIAYNLMYRQELSFDINLPITRNSILGWRRKGDSPCVYLDLKKDST